MKAIKGMEMDENASYEIACMKPSNNRKLSVTFISSKVSNKEAFFLVALFILAVMTIVALTISILTYNRYSNANKVNTSQVDRQLNISLQLKALKNDIHYLTNFTLQYRTDNVTERLVKELQSLHVFDSCAEVARASLPFLSGFYWISTTNGAPVQVYCSMKFSCNGTTGGWRRIAYLNTNNNNSFQCPAGLVARYNPPSCHINTSEAGCSSVIYHSNGISYSCICGKVNAYQLGTPDGFTILPTEANLTLDDNYVDGVSLTYGSNPRKHIWTFSATIDFFGEQGCRACTFQQPSYTMNQFSCELLPEICDPGVICNSNQLWNGGQCFGASLFHRQFSQIVTDDIEMRVCRDEDGNNEDFLITAIEIFVS